MEQPLGRADKITPSSESMARLFFLLTCGSGAPLLIRPGSSLILNYIPFFVRPKPLSKNFSTFVRCLLTRTGLQEVARRVASAKSYDDRDKCPIVPSRNS